jgi:putative membrane protein
MKGAAMWSTGWMHGGWGLGGLGILFWVAVVAVLVLASRGIVWGRRGPDPDGSRHPETPLEILQKRYARGDLSKEEYEQKRRDISS